MSDIVKQSAIEVVTVGDVLVVDSRLVALDLGIEHETFYSVCVNTFGTVPGYLSAFDLLVVWQRSDYLGFDVKCYVQQLKNLFYPHFDEKDKATFDWIACAVVTDISNNIISRNSEHGKVHKWFKLNHSAVIPGSKIIKVVAKNKKRPDFLIKLNGLTYPVECKLSFGTNALKQLQGYMKLWNAPIGFAVASKFVVKMPSNIVVIQSP